MSEVEELARSDLGRLILALAPGMDQLVLCGGWAAYLYRLDESADPVARLPPIPTTDIDWAVPCELPEHAPVLADLMEAHGFRAVRARGETPPVTRYQHERYGARDLGEVYAEFLAPLRGSVTDRDGEVRVTVAPQPGLTALLLRYMVIALDGPLVLDAGRADLGLPPETRVRVPHPANYIVHKALTAGLRPTATGRNKDLAYVYEVVLRYRRRWPELAHRVGDLAASSAERSAWIGRARRFLGRAFENADSFGPSGVASIYRGLDVQGSATRERVYAIMQRGLLAIGLA